MRIALVHENIEYRKQFALNYLGKSNSIILLDPKLDLPEMVNGVRHSGGLDLAIVSIGRENPFALDHSMALRNAYQNAWIIAVEPKLGVRTCSVFEATFGGINLIYTEAYILNHLNELPDLK